MNFKHVARVYLGWFEQEAHNMHTPVPGREDSIIWNDGGTFVLGYTGAEGFRSYQGFVKDLAVARLTPAEADRVIVEAVKLVTEDKAN